MHFPVFNVVKDIGPRKITQRRQKNVFHFHSFVGHPKKNIPGIIFWLNNNNNRSLRLRLFWLKLIFGNHFPENKAFGCYVKFGQTENVFSLTENSAKNDWKWFQSLFSLQMFSSPFSHAQVSHTRTASVKPSLLRPTHRAKRNDPHRRTTIAISPVTETAPIDVDHDRGRADRDWHFARSRSRRSASIAIIEISEIAIVISPIEIAPIAIAITISPRKYAVLLGFIWASGFYLSF